MRSCSSIIASFHYLMETHYHAWGSSAFGVVQQFLKLHYFSSWDILCFISINFITGYCDSLATKCLSLYLTVHSQCRLLVTVTLLLIKNYTQNVNLILQEIHRHF